MMALNDSEDHPYLHLFDGGLADNLGLRAMMDGVLRQDTIAQTLEAVGMQDTRNVIIILVNAETALDVESSRRMKQLPTSFTLPDEAVDRLIAAGRTVLRNNEEFQRLLANAKR